MSQLKINIEFLTVPKSPTIIWVLVRLKPKNCLIQRVNLMARTIFINKVKVETYKNKKVEKIITLQNKKLNKWSILATKTPLKETCLTLYKQRWKNRKISKSKRLTMQSFKKETSNLNLNSTMLHSKSTNPIKKMTSKDKI